MGRYDSRSPVARGSPRRRSPSRREISPDRHRNSKVDRHSDGNLSPKHAPSRSRGFDLPVRDKTSSRPKSTKYRRSPSPAPHSPIRKSRQSRDRSPRHVKSRSQSPISPIKEKPASRTWSPRHVNSRSSRSRSPVSRSLSPRSKRLNRARVERDTGKRNGREYENNHGTKREKTSYDEKDLARGVPSEKRDRRPERDAAGTGSRSGHKIAASPSDINRRGQQRSRSPLSDDRGRDEVENTRDEGHRNGGTDSLSRMKAVEAELETKEKQKPSFELSGKLAAETNRVRGVTLLFNEPPDARKPDIRWRLYVFKGGDALNDPLYVHRQSCYLFGRERRVADIPTDHPSCSKQHAVLQFRQVEVENADGTMSKKVRPYLMDLGSTNGTFVNDNQIEAQRYYELFERDTVKFGNSSREYVLLHENSAS